MGAGIEVLDYVEAELKAADITRVWQDLEDVQAPGVWIALDTIDRLTIGGVDEVTVRLYLVTQHQRQTRAVAELDDLLDQVKSVFRPTEETVLVGLGTTKQPRELAAYRFTTTVTT